MARKEKISKGFLRVPFVVERTIDVTLFGLLCVGFQGQAKCEATGCRSRSGRWPEGFRRI